MEKTVISQISTAIALGNVLLYVGVVIITLSTHRRVANNELVIIGYSGSFELLQV